LDYPEVHKFVLRPAEPEEEDDEDLYVSPEESMCIAQLVSRMTEYPVDVTGFLAAQETGT
jgi:hypothetical protein